MAEGGPPDPAPCREAQVLQLPQQLQQAQQSQVHMHMNWSHLNQNIQENLRKM